MTNDATTDPVNPGDDTWLLIDQALEAATQPRQGWDTNQVWRRVEARTQRGLADIPRHSSRASAVRYSNTNRGSSGFKRRWLPLGGAAALVAVALAIVVINVPVLQPASHNAMQAMTYTTKRAQRAEFTLPDGSRVILGPESRLRYSTAGDGKRTLDLTGQAYFGVTHDEAHPFVVRAGHSVTTVLGTSFTIRAYPTDSLATVAVAEGRISLTGGAAEATLVAGDVGQVAANLPAQVVPNASIADAFGWTRGRLAFDKVAFKDIAIELERAYDLDIYIADSALARRQLSVTLADESITEMLNTVAPPLGATYDRRGKAITFSAR